MQSRAGDNESQSRGGIPTYRVSKPGAKIDQPGLKRSFSEFDLNIFNRGTARNYSCTDFRPSQTCKTMVSITFLLWQIIVCIT